MLAAVRMGEARKWRLGMGWYAMGGRRRWVGVSGESLWNIGRVEAGDCERRVGGKHPAQQQQQQ